jgi:uncharacterized repeat protein (TIGR03803 family)
MYFALALAMVAAEFAMRLSAQTFTTLHSFAGFPGNDAGNPAAGLILSGNTLYGTAAYFGSQPSSGGTVFAVNTDGTGFTNLYTFSDFYGLGPYGRQPNAKLVLSGTTLYGTTDGGGYLPDVYSVGQGTVFAINTDGTGFTNLYFFGEPNDGANPHAGLTLSGNTLYGTTYGGGYSNSGTIFAINIDGTSYTNLYSFTGLNDGANPAGALILSGNTLYGTTFAGGIYGNGSVFAINTDGTSFTNLYSFNGPYDGANPYAGLILSGKTLYGTTYNNGSFQDSGTVFAVNTDGTYFTNLYTFMGGYDGGSPYGGLKLIGNMLYGTASSGGISGNGTVFAISTDGTGFTNIYDFSEAYGPYNGLQANNDGAGPLADLLLSSNILYSTAQLSGVYGFGTIFSLSFAPELFLLSSGSKVILMWPTNVLGFDYTAYTLECSSNLASSASWSTVLPKPTVVNGQNMVTNQISGPAMFYRLRY